jgi:hypothetical protein
LPLASISEKYINYDKVAAWRKPPEFSAYRVFIVEKYPKKIERLRQNLPECCTEPQDIMFSDKASDNAASRIHRGTALDS